MSFYATRVPAMYVGIGTRRRVAEKVATSMIKDHRTAKHSQLASS